MKKYFVMRYVVFSGFLLARKSVPGIIRERIIGFSFIMSILLTRHI